MSTLVLEREIDKFTGGTVFGLNDLSARKCSSAVAFPCSLEHGGSYAALPVGIKLPMRGQYQIYTDFPDTPQ